MVRSAKPARVTLVAAAVGLALAGCGTSDDRDQVRALTERFYTAIEADDGAAACAALSAAVVRAIEDQEGRPCARAVGSLRLRSASIDRVQVYVTSAKVDLGGESAFAGRTADGWRLSAVGCRPVAGDPAERPFDCEAQD